MAHKKVMISTSDEFERKVSKFIHSEKLKGNKTNRSELDREAIEFFIENNGRKRKVGEGK